MGPTRIMGQLRWARGRVIGLGIIHAVTRYGGEEHMLKRALAMAFLLVPFATPATGRDGEYA